MRSQIFDFAVRADRASPEQPIEKESEVMAPARADKLAGAVIIGGAHGSISAARSLGRRGIPVWFFTNDQLIVRFSRYVQRSPEWPVTASQKVELLLETGVRNGLKGWTLFPGSDIEAELLARNYSTLADYFRVTTPSWDVMQWAYDKRLTYRLAAEAGIDFPWTYFPAGREDICNLDGPFPMVLKPAVKEQRNEFTAAKAWRVYNRRTLLARYDQACSLVDPGIIVLQELIPGTGDTQFSYAALWDKHGPVASLVAKRLRQYPIDFGTGTFVETVDEPDVSRAAERLLSFINYTGLVEVEFKYDSREARYKLLDINGRLWTWNALGHRAGVDFPYLMWLQARGKPLPECRARIGSRWIHLSRDLVAAMLEIRRGTLSPRSYVRSLRGPMEFAVFALDDPLPALLEWPLLAIRQARRMHA
jgi:D-aspartate ligase